ncbi:uncharacterized protein TNCV_870411 [Trichonephila clavipes]|nr:uncharacterized protein TNCV_870411 [Trichonephila clavipes]
MQVQVKTLDCIGLIQKCMGARVLDLKSETKKKSNVKGKVKVGRNRLTNSLMSNIQRCYRLTIRNNINDLHSMKTVVCAVYFHLLSSNECPQHGLCPAIINAWCKFQKIEAECNESHYIINTYTRAIYHSELNEALL